MSAEVHGSDDYTLPDLHILHVLADCRDFSRDVAAQNVGKLHAGESLADP